MGGHSSLFPPPHSHPISNGRGSPCLKTAFPLFQNAIITMFTIACFTLTARILMRIYTRRRLYLDDFFIILGFIFLSGSTYLVLHSARSIFMIESVSTGLINKDLLRLSDSISFEQAFKCLSWSAIFSGKFSFLALFKVLIRRLSRRLTIYYWVVVGVAIMTWILLTSGIFIVCPRPCKYINFPIRPDDFLICPC